MLLKYDGDMQNEQITIIMEKQYVQRNEFWVLVIISQFTKINWVSVQQQTFSKIIIYIYIWPQIAALED